jgi:hypothetical protein
VFIVFGCNNKTENTESTIIKDPAEILKPARSADESFLIIPGASIGNMVLGNALNTLSSLGKPDFSDNAMGKGWHIWYGDNTDGNGKKTRLIIYTNYKDNEMKEKVVSEIRVNRGEFKTKNGIGAGMKFEVIQREFPQMVEFAKYRNQEIDKDVFIYDAPGVGIAFEFISYEGEYAKCTAVIVYPKDKTLNTDYILHLPERSLPDGE